VAGRWGGRRAPRTARPGEESRPVAGGGLGGGGGVG
jgi:hypothetical protein